MCPAQNNVLITGGEDSKVNAWTGPVLVDHGVSPKRDGEDHAMDVDEEVPTRKRRRA